jgi:hypothetical protein
MHFIYNLLLTIPHLLLAQNIITLDYLELGSGYYLNTHINITPQFDNYILINLKDSRTLAMVNDYQREDPHYQPDDMIIVVNKETYEGFYEVDLFSINNTPIQMYLPIYYIKTQTLQPNKKYIQSFVGFGNDVNQQSLHSFLHTLYTKHYISYKSFAFNVMGYQMSKMFIGGIPDDVKYKYKYKTEINVNTNHPHSSNWYVNLNEVKITVGNIHTNNNNNNNIQVGSFKANEYLTSVHVSDKKIIIPRAFMAMLNETVFDKFYKKGVCSYRKNLFEYVTCELDEMDEVVCVELCIDDNVFKMCGDSLFEEVERRSSYGMSYFQVNEEGDKFEIGTGLIDYYLTEFDMEKQKIRMFSMAKFNGKYYRNRDVSGVIKIYLGLYAIVGLWSGILVYLKVMKSNKM